MTIKSSWFDRYDGYVLKTEKFIHNGYNVNQRGEYFHSNQAATYTHGTGTIGAIRKAKRHKVSKEHWVSSHTYNVNGVDRVGDEYGS